MSTCRKVSSPSAAAREAKAAWSRSAPTPRSRSTATSGCVAATAWLTSPELWLGDRGKRFTYDALHKTLRERADTAGLEGFHPHKLRHTAAHRWLAAGGSESGLMAVAGWTRPDMLMRYRKVQASARAAEEARKLNLAEL
jgi:integrase